MIDIIVTDILLAICILIVALIAFSEGKKFENKKRRKPMTEIREIVENLKIDIEHFTADIYEKECFFSRVKELEQALDKAETDTKRLDVVETGEIEEETK